MRVFMVVRLFYPWVGGMERQAHKLAKALKEKNIEVEIVTGWWYRGTPQREVLDGIPVFRNHTLWEMFRIRGLRRFGGYLYILTLLLYLWRRRADYDILHVHGLNYHSAAAVLASRWFHRKTLVKLANSGQASDIQKMRTGQQLPLSGYLLPVALKSNRFIATSQPIAEELISAGVSPERIIHLPNGVEVDTIPVKRDYGLQDPVCMTFVGRLHEQKGLDVLFAALKCLLERHPGLNWRVQLVGDGPLRENLKKSSAELGISQQVEFIGMTDRVLEYLNKTDIFILPSRAEGHSNALLEAMTCGLPVIVSDIPANCDVIEHEQNGLLFSAGSPEALAQAMLLLLENLELREKIGRSARETVTGRYSLNAIAERYVNLYQDLLVGG